MRKWYGMKENTAVHECQLYCGCCTERFNTELRSVASLLTVYRWQGSCNKIFTACFQEMLQFQGFKSRIPSFSCPSLILSSLPCFAPWGDTQFFSFGSQHHFHFLSIISLPVLEHVYSWSHRCWHSYLRSPFIFWVQVCPSCTFSPGMEIQIWTWMCQLSSGQKRWVARRRFMLEKKKKINTLLQAYKCTKCSFFSEGPLFLSHMPYPIRCSRVIGFIICDEPGDDGEMGAKRFPPVVAFLMFLFFEVLLKLVPVGRRRGTLLLKRFFSSTMPTAAAAAATQAAPSSGHLCSLVCKTPRGEPMHIQHVHCRFLSLRSPVACKNAKVVLEMPLSCC